MGHRLSKIYTRTGDKGETGLGMQGRIGKDSLRIAAIGDIDELNSIIGWLMIAVADEASDQAMLSQIQHDLFDLGGELAMPGYELLEEALVSDLETHIDRLNEALPPLKNFILPGGNEAAARCHMARSVCRRAERTMVSFNNAEPKGHVLAQQYLNRLSDLLFVYARHLARKDGQQEVLWQSRHKKEG
ncbi:cob(I)yrinic acid a,c-diamide adenosyltransferase [Saccharospirillum salsuginis]|uniref:Corrinoid adenosyltransferase n=1 Tax=Saccharospirillum salsuginis TaxID=418750 RepID=A0A918KFL5_9GAMM|nr:cob(I)yrinic acid a,c-diamide adenosyltransferase [Saccharospirillum salsuginis]GGX59703.1 ATP--cobalamin adenosyltransferase [Saccharospirillum salsuginis]